MTRISPIPWEPIWLLSLLVWLVSAIWIGVRQFRARTFRLPRSPLFYGALALVIAIPVGLKLLDYRFVPFSRADAATGVDPSLPELHTRRYNAHTVDELYEASLQAVQSLSTYGQPWTIVFVNLQPGWGGRIVAKVPAPFRLDTLSITIQAVPRAPDSEEVAFVRLDVYSAAPPGRFDFGENARHIRQFLRALDARLPEGE
ncbi:MAG: DUF1499 domain-containing protein [Caldilineae bacterium]|nr:MAG: DUF1499 domain-containing protein [Caldilineae bacterium]